MKELIEKYENRIKMLEDIVKNSYSITLGYRVDVQYYDEWIGTLETLKEVVVDLKKLCSPPH